ncbi:hypothetical protein B9Z19DRAFT_1129070 [Tuber borchii]|uniref:Uncharacterized protein n=1 Tax=Tuber borchii TaxID=42251 RepID=A0A2T6ZMY6_TUBBO|nr:hypothetical protein B9Z19DRAFT_1129070 [Tuber borchii]
MALMLWYTLFDDSLPNAIALKSQVYMFRGKYTAVRGQFLFHIRTNIEVLYSLPKDPTAKMRRIEYLLEGDRLMCLLNGYEIQLDVQVPCASDYRHDIRQVFQWGKDARDAGPGIFEADHHHGQPARRRQTPIDALVQSLPVGLDQDSLDLSQETDTSLDFSQMSVDLESGFLDLDPAGAEDRCRQTEELGLENFRSPDPSSPLLLSLEDFECGQASPGGGGNIHQDAEGQ